MNELWLDELHALGRQHEMLGKGFLGLALVITDRAQHDGLPLDSATMMTKGGGQVKGAGGAKVKAILERYGIMRRLSAEGGRTSRGTPAKMRAYVEFLNRRRNAQEFDLESIMLFWVERVKDYFASMPFVLELDPAIGVKGSLRALIANVEARQKETPGATFLGTVIQHLVGAKIETALKLAPASLASHGVSVNDAKGRGGDLEQGDTVIHVTTAPGALLIEKCAANISSGLRPMIITKRERVAAAEGLIEDAGLGSRVDVLDFEQFLAINIFELSEFDSARRREAFQSIVDRYNEIVETAEGDSSLKIEIR